MFDTTELKLVHLVRDGVTLAHIEAGPDVPAAPPLVFIHGWIGDHQALLPQITYFARRRRVVAINLRGHGDSDAPQQDYTIDGFADDIAWQCDQLGLYRPLIVGHSLGGMIALELAGRYPDLPSGVVMIDTIIFPPPKAAELARQLLEQISGSDYFGAARNSALDMFMDHVDPVDPMRKDRLLEQICAAHRKTPQHVAVSAFRNMLSGYDSAPAAQACTVPVAYLSAAVPLVEMARDLDRLRALCPQLVVAKTLGAGHFSPLEVPDQINAMIARYLAVGLARPRIPSKVLAG
jgi:pimeloyl-ACP methyl ester carboxylesterase